MSKINHLFLVMISILLFSCSKNSENYGDGMATIKIKFAGTQAVNIDNKVQNKLSTSSKYHSLTALPNIQHVEVPLNNKYRIVATLTREKSNAQTLEFEKLSSTAPKNKIQAVGDTQSDLPAGTKYRLLAYNSSGNFIEYKDYSVGGTLISEDSFRVPTGENYTFVAYSVGTSSTADLDDIMPNGNFNSAKFENVNGNQHFMYYIKPASSYPEGLTTLNIVLKHQFSQIKTIINLSSAVSGTISDISAIMRPHLNNVDIEVDGSIPDYDNGSISPSGATVNFVNTNNDRTTEATTIITAPDQTSDGGGSLLITSITIDGETSTHIPPITDLKIIPGGRYTLTLNVKEFTPDGDIDIDYGDVTWALGNLKYDASTGIYSLAQTSGDYGDYWFPGYDRPKLLDGTNANANNPVNANGESGDPCAKVFPLGAWRLPTDAEYRDLVKSSSYFNPRKRYIGPYDGPGTNTGMYIDTYEHPGVAYNLYMFFSFAGSYNANPTTISQRGTNGYYLATQSNSPNTYKMMQFGNNINTAEIAASINPNSAMQIRCVRNKP